MILIKDLWQTMISLRFFYLELFKSKNIKYNFDNIY